MADIFDQVAAPASGAGGQRPGSSSTTGNIFNQVAPKQISEQLPTPSDAVARATENARQLTAAMNPPPMPTPVPPVLQPGIRSTNPGVAALPPLSDAEYSARVRGQGQTPDFGLGPTVEGAAGVLQAGRSFVTGKDMAGNPEPRAQAAAQGVENTMLAATPAMGGAVAARPLVAARGIVTALLAAKGTKAALDKAGVPEEYARLGADVAGIAAAGWTVKDLVDAGRSAMRPFEPGNRFGKPLEPEVVPPGTAPAESGSVKGIKGGQTIDVKPAEEAASPERTPTTRSQQPAASRAQGDIFDQVAPAAKPVTKAAETLPVYIPPRLAAPGVATTRETEQALPLNTSAKSADIFDEVGTKLQQTAADSGATTRGDNVASGSSAMPPPPVSRAGYSSRVEPGTFDGKDGFNAVHEDMGDWRGTDWAPTRAEAEEIGQNYVDRWGKQREAIAAEKGLTPGDLEGAIAEESERRGKARGTGTPAAGEEVGTKLQQTAADSGPPPIPKQGEAVEARVPQTKPAYGRAASVAVPGEAGRYPVRYAVRELSDVQASHGPTFQENPLYEHTNDRDYSRPGNATRVVQNSAPGTFDPEFLTTDSPTAEHGTPVIDQNGNALGGNSRTMSLDRVYRRGGEDADSYRAQVAAKAQQFGIDPAEIGRFKRPVLVRELTGDADPQRAITDFNKTAAAELTPEERAVSDGRRMSPKTISDIGSRLDDLGEEGTLAGALRGDDGAEVLQSLVKDGVITEQEKGGYLDDQGKLTPEAKARIAKGLVGRLYDTPAEFRATTPETRAKLERIAPQILRVEGRQGWALTDTLKNAIGLAQDARAHKMSADDAAKHAGIWKEQKYDPDTVAMARALEKSPVQAAAGFRRYANDEALSRPGAQESMFRPPTQREAFDDAFKVPEYKGDVRQPRTANAGVTLGSGLGAFEPYLKDAFGEMKDLKAKRDAANAELEKEKATPGQQKFGQRVLESFTGERDLWTARVNQAMEKLRKIVPDPKDQEAISLMRDSKPWQLRAALSGDLLRDKSGPELEAAQRNFERLKPAMERALNPSDAMRAADAVLTKIAGQTLKEGQRLGFLKSRWTAEDYVPHILHPPWETGDVAKPMGDRLGKLLGGKVGKYFSFAEKREFPTLLEAIAENQKPKTLNALDAFTVHGDKFATARATHLLVNQLKDSGVGIVEHDRMKVPKGSVELAGHSPEFRSPQTYADKKTGEDVTTQAPLMVPKYVNDALRPITDPEFLGAIGGFRAMRGFQAYTKAIQLGMSMFHATTENYMALANMGPVGWAKGLRADRTSPEFLSQERDFVEHGGTTAVLGKTVEAYKSFEPGSIPTWSDIWRRAPVAREMDWAAQKLTDFTFGKLQRQFKVQDYAMHKAEWMAKHPLAGDAETAPAMASIAKEINAVYGGLHWENLGVNKTNVELARAVMLAPDWTISNIFNVKYAFEKGTPAGALARKFWMRQLLGGAAATQLLSLALSHSLSKNPTQVYYGKDKDGKDVYQNVFFKGVSGDVINLVHNVHDFGAVGGLMRSMTGKAAPIPRVALQAATNRDFLGREITKKSLSPAANTARSVIEAAKGLAPIPISAINAHEMLLGPDAKKYSVPEFLSTIAAGTPPRHVAPEKFQKYKPDNSLWEQIRTGQAHPVKSRKKAGR